MQIRFSDMARIEFDEVIEYYNCVAPGLGREFVNEVVNALDRIGTFPEAWHPYTKQTRRCQTRRFPYGIVYQIKKDEIEIIAIANLHREPDYWKERI